MSCTVTKNQYGEDEVVFLYKFKIGNCEKSFGLNVARLANLPQQVFFLFIRLCVGDFKSSYHLGCLTDESCILSSSLSDHL